MTDWRLSEMIYGEIRLWRLTTPKVDDEVYLMLENGEITVLEEVKEKTESE